MRCVVLAKEGVGVEDWANVRVEGGLEIDLAHLLEKQIEQILDILRRLITRR